MKWLLNFFRGTVTLVVTGVELEQFLNRCAKAGLSFWAVDWREPFTLAMTVSARRVGAVMRLGQVAQCTVREERRWGLPFFLFRFRRRYALIAGLLAFLLAVTFCARVVLVIEIQGNVAITQGEILSQLRAFGVHPGVYGPSIRQRQLSHQMILAMEELAFFSLTLEGNRAVVTVREEDPVPPVVKEETPTSVVSTAAGIIDHVEILKGNALCKEGDTVLPGDLLISGQIVIPGPPYSETTLGSYLVHAQGRIVARTWHTLEAKIPLTAPGKEETGREKSHYALHILGKRLKFYGNGGISFDKYDKITRISTLRLPNGTPLPLALEKETYRQVETAPRAILEDRAEEMLKERLLQSLQEKIGPQGEILRSDFVTRKADGFLWVTLLGECYQQIGKTVPYEEAPPLPTEIPQVQS